MLPSSGGMPANLRNSMDLFRFLYFQNNSYRQAVKSTTSYYITDVEFDASRGDRGEQKWMHDFLVEELQIKEHMMEQGEEIGCFGNSLTWIYFPFDRKLFDPNDFIAEQDLSSIPVQDVEFSYEKMQYCIPDPRTAHLSAKKRKRVWMKFRDRQSNDLTRIRFRKLDPSNMELHEHQISGRVRYFWRIRNETFYQYLKKGDLFYVNDTPIPILRAVQDDQDFEFDADKIFHMKAPTLSGITNSGWGVPELLANYRDLHMASVYRKIDEAVGLDYMLPIRIFSPNASSQSVGDVTNFSLFDTMQQDLSQMIRQHRQNPTSMFSLPFPVSVTEVSGNGRQLSPKESIEYYDERLMRGGGFPAQLQRPDLQWQAVPITLRLFENQNQFLCSGFNRFLQWTARHVQTYLTMDPMRPRLIKLRYAEDAERRSIIMQLVAGGELPRKSLFELLSLEDPVGQQQERISEDVDIERHKIKAQKDFEREQAMGSLSDALQQEEEGAAGSAPPGMGMTPTNRMQEAEELAQQWGQIEHDGQRSKAMQATKATDPQLYALAKQVLEDTRSQAASAGRAQAFAQ